MQSNNRTVRHTFANALDIRITLQTVTTYAYATPAALLVSGTALALQFISAIICTMKQMIDSLCDFPNPENTYVRARAHTHQQLHQEKAGGNHTLRKVWIIIRIFEPFILHSHFLQLNRHSLSNDRQSHGPELPIFCITSSPRSSHFGSSQVKGIGVLPILKKLANGCTSPMHFAATVVITSSIHKAKL